MDVITELFYEDIEPNNAAIETTNISQISTDTSWNIEIAIENGQQPQRSGYKYRNICESINQIQISIKSDDRKSSPTVKIKNLNKDLLQSHESIKIEVSLSTLLFKIHPYLLKSNSKNRLLLNKDELLKLNNDRNMYRYYYNVDLDKFECVIDGLNIIQIPEHMIKEAIERDLYKKQQVMGKDFRDPVNFLAETQIKKFGDLNQSRLKLQLVLFDEKKKEIVKYLTAPIYSEPIEDTKSEMLAKKSTQNYLFSSPLRIIRCSKVIGYMGGNDSLMLFTSELDDTFNLEIEFYQVENNKRVWEERIKLKPDDVTNKCTIVFKTPKYNEQLLIDKKARTPNTSNNHMINYKYLIKDHPVKVFFRLCRVDKKLFSDEWPFYYAKARCNILNHFHLNHLAEIYKSLKFDDGDSVMKDRNLQNEDEEEDQNSECTTDDEDYSDDDDDSSCEDSSDDDTKQSSKSSINPQPTRPTTSSTSSTKTTTTTSVNQKSGQSAPIKEDGGTQAVRLLVLDRKKKMNALADRTAAALLEVAKSRSVHKVLKTQRYLLNTQNRDGNTPLHLCILNGNFDLLEIIVDCALTIPHYNIINVKNNYQLTPLLLAAHIGESEVCDFLLEANSSLTEVDLNGNNCFHIACKQRNLKLVKVLCNYIKKNVDKSSVINICNYEGETPLILAVKYNAYDIVEELIYTPPCRLEERNKRNGMNALHYSATHNYLQVSRLMLEFVSKADEQRLNNKLMAEFVDAQANNGCTPLHMAIANKNYLIVRLLLKYGANPFAQSLEFAHPKYEEKEKLNTFKFSNPTSSDSSNKTSNNNDSEKISEDVKDIHSSQESQRYNNANMLLRHNNDAYYYVGDDKMMLEVLRNEKYVPKRILNKIFQFEFDRKKEKLPVEKQSQCDKLVGKKDNNQEIDFIEHFENKIKEYNPGFQFNRVLETTPLKRSATESYVASPGSIDSADDEGTETPEIKKTRKDLRELVIDE